MKREDFYINFLSEFIYKLSQKRSLILSIPWYRFAVPCVGFKYDKSRPTKILDDIQEKQLIDNPRENVLGILSNWDSYAEGIFFTSYAIYVNDPKNSMEKFKVNYFNIKKLEYYGYGEKPILEIYTHSNKCYKIDTDVFSKLNIKIILEAARGFTACLSEREKDIVNNIKLDTLNGYSIGSMISGTIMGNAGAANTIWRMDTFHTQTGHGFAAERMNHLYDLLHGKDVEILGNDNKANGADRFADGVFIQSKYCQTGQKCINECFDKNGNFRYVNQDGTAMTIEVPADEDIYNEAVEKMAEKIRQGKVPGHTNPDDAKDIVKKGRFTYEQAKKVAQAGTVESLLFDATNGVIICTSAFGVTALITFATCIWNGDSIENALKSATFAGLKVGGTAFLTTVLSSQLARTGVAKVAGQLSAEIVNILGPKATQILVNALRSNSVNIYGAAASKHLAKMLRGNLITGIVSIAVLSVNDIVNIFEGRISGTQFVKNVGTTAGGVAGGYAGWAGGASAGATIGSFIPVVGTAIGGLAGALIGACAGGSLGQSAANELFGLIIEDDSVDIVKLIKNEIVKMSKVYLLNSFEVENVCDNLSADLDGNMIKDIFGSTSRETYVDKLIEIYIGYELEYRSKIRLPNDKMQSIMIQVLKEISEDM